MKDYLPSLFLITAGIYIWWTTRSPAHANPRFARAVATGLILLGTGALIFSLLIGV